MATSRGVWEGAWRENEWRIFFSGRWWRHSESGHTCGRWVLQQSMSGSECLLVAFPAFGVFFKNKAVSLAMSGLDFQTFPPGACCHDSWEFGQAVAQWGLHSVFFCGSHNKALSFNPCPDIWRHFPKRKRFYTSAHVHTSFNNMSQVTCKYTAFYIAYLCTQLPSTKQWPSGTLLIRFHTAAIASWGTMASDTSYLHKKKTIADKCMLRCKINSFTHSPVQMSLIFYDSSLKKNVVKPIFSHSHTQKNIPW